MTRRDAMAIAAGAVAGAAIVACVYETRGTQSRPSAAPSGLARNGAPGTDAPQQPAVTGDDAWRAANAGLVVRERDCRHHLAASEMELTKVKATLASLQPDGGPLGAGARRDPYNPTTQEDWKQLAKMGVVAAKNYCFPGGDWKPSEDELRSMGLTADDAPALTKAVATASQRLWQATEPACAKLVGADEAARLGNEDCFTIILHHFSEGQWGSDAALVSNIRAGNTPMPAPDQLDALAIRLLAMTDAVQGFEKDLGQSLGLELAEEIATGHAPWGCTMALGEGARTGAFLPK